MAVPRVLTPPTPSQVIPLWGQAAGTDLVGGGRGAVGEGGVQMAAWALPPNPWDQLLTPTSRDSGLIF